MADALIDILRFAIPAAYAAAFAAYAARFLSDPDREDRSYGWPVLLVAALLHSAWLALYAGREGRCPFGTPGEALQFSGWVLALSYLVLERATRLHVLGVFFAAPIVGASLGILQAAGTPWPLRIQSPWFAFHASAGATGLAFLSGGSILALIYLVQYRELVHHRFGRLSRRLPDLPSLERFLRMMILAGSLLVGLGLVLGLVWIIRYDIPFAVVRYKFAIASLQVACMLPLPFLRRRGLISASQGAWVSLLGIILSAALLAVGTHGV